LSGTRVALIGHGAIGTVVAEALRAGEVPGAHLACIVGHHADADPGVVDAARAIERADLFVECAGQEALAEHGAAILAAGRDLLVVSIGALADPVLRKHLLNTGPGRLLLSSGAVGGLDILRAAAAFGPLTRVSIETTKSPASLVQGWMSGEQADALRHATAPVEVMRGSAVEVTAAFPRSANVAAALAMAVGDWSIVEATVVGDPAALRTRHVITAEGAAGRYRFEIENRPSRATPTTSAVTAHAVLRGLRDLVSASPGQFL
jgi:aspartate dehydrogenase